MNGDMEELSRIASEHHREFMAALAIRSDMEVAYRLQLAEAMAASIASQPPQPAPTTSINDVVNLQTLETEFKDRLVIETETKKLRPYGEGSSSSSSKTEDDAEVTGQWPPKQQKTINILHHVNLLMKSFTYCALTLIARKDVKFAFKLAREAVSSQISKEVSSLEKLESCVICLDDKSVDQFFSIKGCTHQYCYSCMKQHVEVKLLSGVLPKCPHEGCGNELIIESCEKFLTPKFTEMMRQRLKEDSIPVTEKVYCPYPKCSTLMSITEARRHPVSVYGTGARACYNCHGHFCFYCRVPWHENITCAEYKRRNPTSVMEESKLKNLAARKLWRQCIKCKHMIELAAGCYHMTCRCGYEFCYTCGAEWKNKKATCTCLLWDEEYIMGVEEEADEDDDFNDFEDAVVREDDHFEPEVVPEDDYFEHEDVLAYSFDEYRYEYDEFW